MRLAWALLGARCLAFPTDQVVVADPNQHCYDACANANLVCTDAKQEEFMQINVPRKAAFDCWCIATPR